jgi:hypothetical protein
MCHAWLGISSFVIVGCTIGCCFRKTGVKSHTIWASSIVFLIAIETCVLLDYDDRFQRGWITTGIAIGISIRYCYSFLVSLCYFLAVVSEYSFL